VPALAAAVSEAGGLGFLGGGYSTPEHREAIERGESHRACDTSAFLHGAQAGTVA